MIGGKRTFKRIVDLKAIIDCTTCPGAILTIAPTHIPGYHSSKVQSLT
jgi:hypothetical protein